MVTTEPIRLDRRLAAVAFAAVAAASFLVIDPPVGDFWAARARESAAAHGVGLGYWFAWFGGTVPGNYSVLLPFLSRVVSVGSLGAVATVAIVGECYVLVRGSRHPALATWTAAFAASLNLWSGRIPFATGTAIMLLALLAVRHERRWWAVGLAVVMSLVSPVSGAFLILGLVGVVVHDRARRVTALLVIGVVVACLGAVVLYYASPGPEGFPATEAAGAFATTAVLLLARPPAYLRTVLFVSMAACPLIALVPNGLGSNFERFTWLCLPVAVAATGAARPRITASAVVLALVATCIGSTKTLYVATRPMSTYAYVSGLVGELDRTPGLADYRVEVVPDGTHVAAFALLGHAQQAQGFETQSANAYDAVLHSTALTARTYRRWLDENAVGYVAIDRHTLVSGPEDSLVRSRPAYLHLAWSDSDWQLFRVAAARPVVAAPARVVDADQANLKITAPRAGEYELRVRWSGFLTVSGGHGATIESDGAGWTRLTVTQPGRYTVS